MGDFLSRLVKRADSQNVQEDSVATIPEIQPVDEWDEDAVRRDLVALMDSDSYDDGSYAPILIRLGWHSSGTFDGVTGGSSGAGMRFPLEKNDPENKGLHVARDVLAPLKMKHPAISYSDMWILAAYTAIEHTGGPRIAFTKGRIDITKALDAIKPGRLPDAEYGLGSGMDDEGRIEGWEKLAEHVRQVFYRIGMNDQEIVALLCGGHVYGRCHKGSSGYSGAWVEAPTSFSNEYAADLLEDEWMCVSHDTRINGVLIPEETRPAPGKRQYMSEWEPSEEEIKQGHAEPEEKEGKLLKVKYQMMLPSDMIFLWDDKFKKVVSKYAASEDLLREDFGSAYKKLTESGMTGCPFH